MSLSPFDKVVQNSVQNALSNAGIVVSGGAIQSISSGTQAGITTAVEQSFANTNTQVSITACLETALGQIMIPLMRMASPNFMGTISSGSSSSTTASFNDTLAGYSVNQLLGGYTKILSAVSGVIYQASISANTSQTVTVNSLAGNYTPANGDTYAVLYPISY
jgi:hypothetical protein